MKSMMNLREINVYELEQIANCKKCRSEAHTRQTESKLLAMVKCSNPKCNNEGESCCFYDEAIRVWNRAQK